MAVKVPYARVLFRGNDTPEPLWKRTECQQPGNKRQVYRSQKTQDTIPVLLLVTFDTLILLQKTIIFARTLAYSAKKQYFCPRNADKTTL